MGLAYTYMGIVNVLIYGSAVCLNTLCSQAMGAKNYKLAGHWLQLALITLTVTSIPVIASFFYVAPVLKFFVKAGPGAEYTYAQRDALCERAGAYSRRMALTVWPVACYCAIRQYFQAQGIVWPATVVSCAAAVVNVGFNWLLIHGVGSWRGLGFLGSPLATFSAIIFQLVAFLLYACWWKRLHVKTWPGFALRHWKAACARARVRTFLAQALPYAFYMGCDEWAYEIITLLAGEMGPDQVSTQSVLFTLWGLLWAIFWGFGLATQIRVGEHLGAGAPRRARRAAMLGCACAGAVSLLAAALTALLRRYVVELFSSDAAVLRVTESVLPIFVLSFLSSVLALSIGAVLEGMGRPGVLAVIAFVASWCVLLPTAWGLAFDKRLWGTGKASMKGLWWGSVAGETVRWTLCGLTLCRVKWAEMAKQARERSEVAKRKKDDGDGEGVDGGADEAGRAAAASATASPVLGPASPRLPPRQQAAEV